MRNKLPNKPSELIRLAVSDMQKAKAHRSYTVNMGQWHVPIRGGRCVVCAAGSVMAFSLGTPKNVDAVPYTGHGYSQDEVYKLLALNWFRSGKIKNGLVEMGIHLKRGIPEEIEISKPKNWDEFIKDMLKMADSLECSGL